MALPVVNRGCNAPGDSDTELGHGCDDLAAVYDHLPPEALGCKNWLSARLSSVAELEQVLERIDSHDGTVPPTWR